MTFIQTPGILDGQIHALHGIQGNPKCMDGTAQDTGVGDVKVIAFGFEQFTGLSSFFTTFFGQIHIGPARETVFQIPLAFAMSHQYKLKHKSLYIKE